MAVEKSSLLAEEKQPGLLAGPERQELWSSNEGHQEEALKT